MSGYELEINPNVTCRTCLSQENELRNIFSNSIIDGEIIPFPMVLEESCNIKVTKIDGMPDKICLGCKTNILNFYSFKQMCNRSNNLLQNIYFKQNDLKKIGVSFVRIISDDPLETGMEENTNDSHKSTGSDTSFEYIFECSVCNESFKNETLLNSHIELVHNRKIQILTDNQSPNTSKSDSIEEIPTQNFQYTPMTSNDNVEPQNLSKNTRSLPGDDKLKPKICMHCSKTFRKASDLQRHIDTHFQVRYKCRICAKTYTQIAPRNRHMKMFHPDEMRLLLMKGEKPFSIRDPNNQPIKGKFILQNKSFSRRSEHQGDYGSNSDSEDIQDG